MIDENMKGRVLSGLLWKFSERILAQLVTLIVSIILARLLMPDEYGAVALIMVFISLANVFVSSGLGSSLVQKEGADNLDFSSVFWINIFLSIFIYIILFWASSPISDFYSMPILKPAIRVLAIRIPVAAINSVQQAFVSKHMLFKCFFLSTLFGTVISGGIGIYMAYHGYGIWALVMQYLVNTCTDTLVLWFTVRWRPAMIFSWSRARHLISFGWKLLVSALLDTGYNQLRNLLIGKLYTATDLAYYNQGDKYPSLIIVNVNSSIGSVLFPVMSHYQTKIEHVKNITRRSIQVSSYVIWPLMIGLAVVSEPMIRILLTPKWLPCVPYLRIFCFTYGLWPIHTANLQAINAIGRSDLFLKMEIAKKTIGICSLIFSIRYGPFIIAFSLFVTGIIAGGINAAPNIKLLHYKIGEQLSDLLSPFLLAMVMGGVILPLQRLPFADFVIIIIQVLCGVLIYLLGSVLTKQKGFYYLFNLFKQKIKKQLENKG